MSTTRDASDGYKPLVGLGIVTYRSLLTLQPLVERVIGLYAAMPPFWVADDGSRDGTSEYLEAWRIGSSYPHAGVASNRNRVLDHLFGRGCSVVVTLDDDAEITEDDWLDHWTAAVIQFGVVFFDASRGSAVPVRDGCVSAHGFGITRGAYEILGGFDERYDSGWGFEDEDLARRWRRGGFSTGSLSYGIAGGGTGRFGDDEGFAFNRRLYESFADGQIKVERRLHRDES